MNPFRFSLNRKRFIWPGLHFSGNSAMLENSRDGHGFRRGPFFARRSRTEGAQFVERLPP